MVLVLFLLEAAHALDVVVHGVAGAGAVGCALYTTPKGFPSDAADATSAVEVAASSAIDGVVKCRFATPKATRVAVAVRHDRNGNGKLDTNLVGMPREPYGFSRDAPLRTFGPPKFEDAAVSVTSDIHVTLREP